MRNFLTNRHIKYWQTRKIDWKQSYFNLDHPHRDLILKAIDRVSLATNVMTNAISIVIKGDMMVVSAQSPENGSAEEDIPIDCNIDFVKRNYNSKYLLELLSSLNSDSVIFYFAEKPGIPNVILNPAADNEYYIIMPMSD